MSACPAWSRMGDKLRFQVGGDVKPCTASPRATNEQSRLGNEGRNRAGFSVGMSVSNVNQGGLTKERHLACVLQRDDPISYLIDNYVHGRDTSLPLRAPSPRRIVWSSPSVRVFYGTIKVVAEIL